MNTDFDLDADGEISPWWTAEVFQGEKKTGKKYNHSASPSFHKFHTMQKKDINYLPHQSRAVMGRGGQRDRERKELWFYKESICIAVRKHSLREWRKTAA